MNKEFMSLLRLLKTQAENAGQPLLAHILTVAEMDAKQRSKESRKAA